MFRRMMRFYRLYARLDFGWLMQDPLSCGVYIISDIVTTISAISSVLLLAVRFGGIGGLNEAETLFMLGYSTLANGVFTLFFGNNNVAMISRRIGRSQIDHMLIQPLPLPAQLACEGFAPVTSIGKLACAIVVLWISVAKLGAEFTWQAVPMMLLLIPATCGILLGVSYLISSLAFLQPVSCEEISSIMINAMEMLGRFPLSGVGVVMRALLISVFPAGMMGWFPALVLLGKTPLLPGLIWPVFLCVFLCILASLTFERGMKHYVKVGSNRYKKLGHRG
ncbi:MAG: ABC-2 family transporter protein [Clostridia bacterium]|nr:ABC-2 family transporter protein [Clostridia bacterium]